MSRRRLASALVALVLLSSEVALGAGQLGTAEEARAMLDSAVAALKPAGLALPKPWPKPLNLLT